MDKVFKSLILSKTPLAIIVFNKQKGFGGIRSSPFVIWIYTVKKNPDDFPAITGLPRYFQINLDWFPVDDLPEIFGCSSITRNAIRKYPFVLPHISVLSSTVPRSKVACNPFMEMNPMCNWTTVHSFQVDIRSKSG